MTSRTRRILIVVLAALLLPTVAVFGSYQLRRTLKGDQTICTVTAESLAVAAAEPGGGSYTGGDHPADPEVGDRYVGLSGCLPGELSCLREIEVLGTRLVC